MPKNSCIMQIWAEPAKSALPICNYSQILYRFLTFTQNLKRSSGSIEFPIGEFYCPPAPLPLVHTSFQYFFLFIAVQKLRASLSLPCYFSMSFRSSAISSCDCLSASSNSAICWLCSSFWRRCSSFC